jgi:hypothetical protein
MKIIFLFLSFSVMNKLYIVAIFFIFFVLGGGVCLDIDTEFAEFVCKNFGRLTENQRRICLELGFKVD